MQNLQTSTDSVRSSARSIPVHDPLFSARAVGATRQGEHDTGFPAAPLLSAGSSLPPILVADDDEDDIFFVQRLIKKTGAQNRVIAFDDGSEVVNFLGGARRTGTGRNREPLLLFLDLKMAGLGGFGFLEWARGEKDLWPLKIVVLSNSSEPEDMEHALALGAHRYLVKYPCVHTFTTIVRSVYPVAVY